MLPALQQDLLSVLSEHSAQHLLRHPLPERHLLLYLLLQQDLLLALPVPPVLRSLNNIYQATRKDLPFLFPDRNLQHPHYH